MKLESHELYAALGVLMQRIEMCGASPELTDAVMLASDIRSSVGNRWNRADEFAADRVCALLAPFTESDVPTPEQRAAWRKELFEKCPTPEDRLALMTAPSREAVLAIVRDVLEDNAFIQHGDPLDPNITFQELNMDSLDITRLVVEVGVRFGIVIDTEDVWPSNVTELVNQIESQLKRT